MKEVRKVVGNVTYTNLWQVGPARVVDGDVMLIPTQACHISQCQRWIDGMKMYPLLAPNDKGFYCCPDCGASYGTDPK
jgi:hypothetical protein